MADATEGGPPPALRDLRPSEIFREISSPGFLMRPPDIRHPERIPPAAWAAMDVSWNRRWFAPRPITIAVLENVFVVHEGLVLTDKLEIVRSTILQHRPDEIGSARADVVRAREAGAVPRLRAETVLCRKPGAANYGHWLVELLPKAWVASQHWPRPLRFMIQAVPDPLRAVMRETLARIGIGPDLCSETGASPVWVEKLILVDGLTEHGTYLSPLVIDCLDAMSAAIPPAGERRLFVTRGAAVGRHIVDEASLIEQARGADFAVVDPALLPFSAQVARFRAAARVVGAMGAALTNLIFCVPGAEARVLAPAMMRDTFFWFLSELRDLDYVEIRCEQVGPALRSVEWNTALRVDDDDRDFLVSDSSEISRRISHAELNAKLREFFDRAYYDDANPDVAASDFDPLTHYINVGWAEGRDPSARFDTRRYLAAHPDVAAARMNPLLHYLYHGLFEGRPIFPAPDRTAPRRPDL